MLVEVCWTARCLLGFQKQPGGEILGTATKSYGLRTYGEPSPRGFVPFARGFVPMGDAEIKTFWSHPACNLQNIITSLPLSRDRVSFRRFCAVSTAVGPNM